jgi:LPS export ABC transporter protein LptC
LKPRFAWSALAALLVVSAPSAYGASDDSISQTLVVDDMTFVGSRDSRAEVVLTARRARFDHAKAVAHLEDVSARVTGEGKGGFEMSCDRADYFVDTNDFTAEGHVRGQTQEGRQFRTARLHYDHEQALARTEVPVVIDDVHGRFRGGGFRYHVAEGRFQLIGGATVEQQGATAEQQDTTVEQQ